jgi:aminomethyltransferase
MALLGFERIDHFGDAHAEAKACRAHSALFDFSFLESVQVAGDRAKEVIEAFTGRSLNALGIGKIYYALRVEPSGNAVADLTIWRTGENVYEVMSGRREDVTDLVGLAGLGIEATDLTSRVAIFALQGPRSLDVLRRLGDTGIIEKLVYFGFGDFVLDGVPCRVGRLGYTGEPGFEIIISRNAAPGVWRTLAQFARPAGFIAIDMLRIEAGFLLFSNEFRLPVSPEEAGLEKFHGAGRRELSLISFHAVSDTLRLPWEPSNMLRRPAAPGEIAVTSACRSIAASGILGLGYVRAGDESGAELRDPNGVFRKIRRAEMPFYDPAKKRPRATWSSF